MKIHSCVRQYLTVYSFNIPVRLRSVMEKKTLQKMLLESAYPPPVPSVLGSLSPGVEEPVQEAEH
jgi:redox-regulated HSP33 family molecular chaperone